MVVTATIPKDQELSGAVYDRRRGASCPRCGFGRARVYSLRPPEHGIQVRYHKCTNCGESFKSLEILEERRGKSVLV